MPLGRARPKLDLPGTQREGEAAVKRLETKMRGMSHRDGGEGDRRHAGHHE